MKQQWEQDRDDRRAHDNKVFLGALAAGTIAKIVWDSSKQAEAAKFEDTTDIDPDGTMETDDMNIVTVICSWIFAAPFVLCLVAGIIDKFSADPSPFSNGSLVFVAVIGALPIWIAYHCTRKFYGVK